MRASRSRKGPLLALAGLVALSLGAGVIAFGPDRALRMAAAAALNVSVDGLAENPGPHRIRVVDIEVAEKDLAKLQENLPFSGTDWKSAVLIDNGTRYPVKFRYRGFGPIHHLGGKKSFRLKMKRDGPFGAYKRLNFLNPKAQNMVNVSLAYWIASRMGVATPYEDFVFVRMNGEDHGVMHLCEQIDGDFERNRHLVDGDVPVFKGDFPPTNVRLTVNNGPLWRAAKNWEFMGDADSTVAKQKLEGLIWLVNQRNMPWAVRRDSLEQLIDIDAFLRYAAAMKVIDTRHIDNYHNQILVLSPRSGKFYPVLWDPILLYAPKEEPFYPVYDALSYWLLRDPEWRWIRDRYVRDALTALHTDSAFYHQMDRMLERIKPSVMADRNKTGTLSNASQDVDRSSIVHWAMSAEQLRGRMAGYWNRLTDEFSRDSLKVEQSDRSVRITGSALPPLEITITGDSLEWDTITPGPNYLARTMDTYGAPDALTMSWFPLAAKTDSGGLYRDDQRYLLQPWDMTLRLRSGHIRTVDAHSYFQHGESKAAR